MAKKDKTKKDGKEKNPKKLSKELEKLKKDFDKLNEEKELLEKEKNQTFEKLQRLSADYANYQKRAPKQIQDSVNFEKEKIIKAILPTLDNFEHTLTNIQHNEHANEIYKGVRIVYDQMLDTLKSLGVKQISSQDETFDPNKHQAMMQKSQPDKKDNQILQEFQKGYMLNERVLRPSKVVVNKLAEKNDESEKSSDENENNDQPEQKDSEE
jgi:molecular chaperone GrpE